MYKFFPLSRFTQLCYWFIPFTVKNQSILLSFINRFLFQPSCDLVPPQRDTLQTKSKATLPTRTEHLKRFYKFNDLTSLFIIFNIKQYQILFFSVAAKTGRAGSIKQSHPVQPACSSPPACSFLPFGLLKMNINLHNQMNVQNKLNSMQFSVFSSI